MGLLWVATFYITQGSFPVGALGYWNLMIGFALMLAGFLMTTRWR
ncbi:MAG TPA: cell division protein CrgA [Segeticoccus sp.]|nr:cell division protein CrgA [Segeticoccus sp.]HET8600071.1 cell division protein CrgA [Segeticoccus sp.]